MVKILAVFGTRPEAVESGTVKLVGTNKKLDCEMINQLLTDNIGLVGLEKSVKSADIIALLVDHASFKSMDLSLLSGKQVIDTRGIWS